MSLSCSQSTSQSQCHSLRCLQSLSESYGESSGDIPVYSMHRIKTYLKRVPMQLGEYCVKLLQAELIKANAIYQAESGNAWSCLTSHNLVHAFEKFDDALSDMIEKRKSLPDEKIQLEAEKAAALKIIQQWFEDNFENLLYDMKGYIPWPILSRLRKDLHAWVLKSYNPFTLELETLIIEVAAEKGYGSSKDVEGLWKKMGGKIFTKKEDE